MTWLFLADVHLEEQRPELTRFFCQILQRYHSVARLYILGDLFESWIGDDDDAAWLLPIRQALNAFRDRLYLVQGNRDFLLGQQFAQEVGACLLPEEQVITLPDQSTALLLHGDLLCTDDAEYQKFRTQMHSPAWQQGILKQSLAQRRQLARLLRQQSQAQNAEKATYLMDVNAEAVHQALNRHHTQRLIHGHTHRPQRHQQSGTERWVLGDWSETSTWVVLATPEGLNLLHLEAE